MQHIPGYGAKVLPPPGGVEHGAAAAATLKEENGVDGDGERNPKRPRTGKQEDRTEDNAQEDKKLKAENDQGDERAKNEQSPTTDQGSSFMQL